MAQKSTNDSSGRESPSPSPERGAKRMRRQVIYTDDGENSSKESPVKSPSKEEMTEDSDNIEYSEEGLPDNSAKEPTKVSGVRVKNPEFYPIRKTAPITLPLGGELHPGIKKGIEEHRKREIERILAPMKFVPASSLPRSPIRF